MKKKTNSDDIFEPNFELDTPNHPSHSNETSCGPYTTPDCFCWSPASSTLPPSSPSSSSLVKERAEREGIEDAPDAQAPGEWCCYESALRLAGGGSPEKATQEREGGEIRELDYLFQLLVPPSSRSPALDTGGKDRASRASTQRSSFSSLPASLRRWPLIPGSEATAVCELP
jgi:hypothetical protein